MQIQIEFWQLFMMIVTLLGGYWMLVKIIVGQFQKRLDEKFSMQESARATAQAAWDLRFTDLDKSNRRQERELLELKADLPKLYVQREDWIRFGATVDAKLDRLHNIVTKIFKGGTHE